MPTFLATPLDLQVSMLVAADCSVLDITPDSTDVIRQCLTNRHRILRIGSQLTPDRSALRDILANLPDEPVEVEYDLIQKCIGTEVGTIGGSVEINGRVAPVRNPAEAKAALLKMLREEEGANDDDKGDKKLLAFDTMDRHDSQQPNRGHESIQNRLERAVIVCKPGRCIIAVCHGVNPIGEIELLAHVSQKKVYAVDCSLKVRNRPKPAQITAAFVEAMRSGSWFAVLHGNKSIATLQLLEALLRELHERNLEGVHKDSRIFICMEQHPHFPRALTEKAIIMKFVASFSNSGSCGESALNSSTSLMRAVTGMGKSQMLSPQQKQQSAGLEGPVRRVRIAPSVNIVDIEARDVLPRERPSSQPINVSGSVVLTRTFNGQPNDKFLCIADAGERNRFAVGSSLGNVYFLDHTGLLVMQLHAHDASIWDLAFREKYVFATGSEDSTSAEWAIVPAEAGSSDLQQRFTCHLGNDVYCVKYLNDTSSVLVTGGLPNKLLVRGNDGKQFELPTDCSVQVIKSLRNSPVVIVGGGDGTVFLHDIEHVTHLTSLSDHNRKVPTITVRNDQTFYSGSFDSTIRAWDTRLPSAASTLTLQLKNYVTGLDVDDNHLAACVGENLYLWDVRKLGEVLGGFPKGWNGLSRGVRVHSATNTVVTASPDGAVRFWRFV